MQTAKDRLMEYLVKWHGHDEAQTIMCLYEAAENEAAWEQAKHERAACLAAVESTIADHDEDTPGGWCAANAARHAANAIRNRKE